MSKKSFKDIGSQAARAFITIDAPAQAAEPTQPLQTRQALSVAPQAAVSQTKAAPQPPLMAPAGAAQAGRAKPPPVTHASDSTASMVPERRPGRPRTNRRAITKSSQENLPENWTRATFIVREDLLDAFKERSAEDGITLKEAVNAALEQYLSGGIVYD